MSSLFPGDRYLRCYRWKQWRKSGFEGRPLLPRVPTFRADIFHGLNQRVDHRPAAQVVSTFHDLFVMTAKYSSPDFRDRFTRQARLAAANSDLIIAVSQFTATQVQELLSVPTSRIRVVPHGVHMPSAVRRVSDPPFVLFVGAIQTRKNVLRLLQAFERLPEPWRLVLAGSPTGYGATEILDSIQRSSAATRIDVAGYVSESRLSELYASAAVFAFPSLDEGFGIPVLEAMAHGTPVLTSCGSALREVAGDAAILVQPTEVDDIARGLIRLSEDSELRDDLSRAGKKRAAEYSWERAIRATHAVYEELRAD